MLSHSKEMKKMKIGKYTLVQHHSSSYEEKVWALPGGGTCTDEELKIIRSKLV